MPNLLDKSWIYGCLDSQAIILMSTGENNSFAIFTGYIMLVLRVI